MLHARQMEARPLATIEDLVSYFEDAAKPRNAWRVGTEHEVIGVSLGSHDFAGPIPYEGERGISAVLESLAALPSSPWSPLREGDNIIALEREGAQITLEPGGQMELGSRPAARNDEIRADLDSFLGDLSEVSHRLGLTWLGEGFRPFGSREDVPWMPKRRYAVMREYLPRRGHLAHDMMKRTATVQANLDYSDGEDAGAKLRCSMSISPLLTAIFSNSPIVNGTVSGYQSFRAHAWQHTDPDRCGLLEAAFSGGDVFRAYSEWALDVPMFFVYRNGEYLPTRGVTFRRFMHDGIGGHVATMSDWELHLSTLFPEVRLKPFIEVRGCDAGSLPMVLALAPLARGLLYDDIARAEATLLTNPLDFAQRVDLLRAVARDGLSARVPGRRCTVHELARILVSIAEDGLARQAPDELRYLDPIRAIVGTGRTQADDLVDLWQRSNGDPRRVVAARAHQLPA